MLVKRFLKGKWVIPVASLILAPSIGSAVFAATGSTATTTPAATATNPWGNQRSDETLLTGTTLDQVKAAAPAKVCLDAAIVRIETDSDASVAVDESFNLVSVESQPTGGHGCIHAGGPANGAGSTSTDSTSTTSSN